MLICKNYTDYSEKLDFDGARDKEHFVSPIIDDTIKGAKSPKFNDILESLHKVVYESEEVDNDDFIEIIKFVLDFYAYSFKDLETSNDILNCFAHYIKYILVDKFYEEVPDDYFDEVE